VKYEDGDAEELEADQVLSVLTDPGTKDSLVKALADLKKLLLERKKTPDERNEFLFSFNDRPPSFFGSSVKERRRLCCSIHNYCIFSHTADECQCDEGVKVWHKATASKPCIFRHDPECCKCDRIAMTVGQDESVFHAYLLGKFMLARSPPPPFFFSPPHSPQPTFSPSIGNKTWYVQGKVGLRKKSNGPGCHVSAFVGHSLGFGLRVIDHDTVLRLCNESREGQTSAVDDTPKVKLRTNPAIRYAH